MQLIWRVWIDARHAAVENVIQDLCGFSLYTYFFQLPSNCYLMSSWSFSSEANDGLFSSSTLFLNSLLWHWVKPHEWCRGCSVETKLKRKFSMSASQINAWLQIVFLFNYSLFSGVRGTHSTACVRKVGVTVNPLSATVILLECLSDVEFRRCQYIRDSEACAVSKNKTRDRACHLLSRWFLSRLIRPWRWRRYVPPKCRLTFSGLHGVISQKTVLFITTAVRTSNYTKIREDHMKHLYLSVFIPIAPTWSIGHPWNASFHFVF
jgi:hypothetical protein